MPESCIHVSHRKTERLEARVPIFLKRIIQRAADLQGRSITDFVIAALDKSARETVRDHEMMRLNAEDSLIFAKALTNNRSTKDGLDMAFQEIEGNMATDDIGILFKTCSITRSKLCCDLEAHMDELAEVWVIVRACWIMSQGRDELPGSPISNSFERWKFHGVNVDDRGVGGCQLVETEARSSVNLLGNGQPIFSRLGQSNDLLKPSGSSRFDMESASVLFDKSVDDVVDQKLIAA